MKGSQNEILKKNKTEFEIHLVKAENHLLMTVAELRLLRKALHKKNPSSDLYSINHSRIEIDPTGKNNFIKTRRGLNK